MNAPDITMVAHPMPLGCGDYDNRLGLPTRTLATMGQRTSVVMTHQKDWFARGLTARLTVIQMLASPMGYELLMARREKGLPTVVEISDDFLNFQPANPKAAFYGQAWVRDAIFTLMASADLVQFSSVGLAQRFAPWAKAPLVAHNAVEHADLPPWRPGPPWKVGMAFSGGHAEDVARATPALHRLLVARPDVEVHLMCAAELFSCFSGLGGRVKHVPAMDYTAYRDHIAEWHVMVMPAVNDAFNLGRSDGKWADACRAGTVAVVPDQLPYNASVQEGATGIFYRDITRLDKVLGELLRPDGPLPAIRTSAHGHIMTQRTWQKEMQHRLAHYQEHLDWTPGKGPGEALEGWDDEETALYGHMEALPGAAAGDDRQQRLAALSAWCSTHPAWAGPRETLLRCGIVPPEGQDGPPLWELLWLGFGMHAQAPLTPPLAGWPTAQALHAHRLLSQGDHRAAAAASQAALKGGGPLALRAGILLAAHNDRRVKLARLLAELIYIDPAMGEEVAELLGLKNPPQVTDAAGAPPENPAPGH